MDVFLKAFNYVGYLSIEEGNRLAFVGRSSVSPKEVHVILRLVDIAEILTGGEGHNTCHLVLKEPNQVWGNLPPMRRTIGKPGAHDARIVYCLTDLPHSLLPRLRQEVANANDDAGPLAQAGRAKSHALSLFQKKVVDSLLNRVNISPTDPSEYLPEHTRQFIVRYVHFHGLNAEELMYKRIKFRSQYPVAWEPDDQFRIAKSRYHKTIWLLPHLDAAGRPVVCIPMKQIHCGKFARRQLEMWTVKVIEDAIQRLLSTSQHQTKGVTLLISLKGTTLANYDVAYLKWLFDAIFHVHPGADIPSSSGLQLCMEVVEARPGILCDPREVREQGGLTLLCSIYSAAHICVNLVAGPHLTIASAVHLKLSKCGVTSPVILSTAQRLDQGVDQRGTHI
eukprot:scaffold4463_cov367-Prasinococcus_capsulatus_cf.AAC.7